MRYQEEDIMHENGDYWVLREMQAYQVCKTGLTHSVSNEAYPKTPDGLAIAIARCDYLAKRAAEKKALADGTTKAASRPSI